MQALSNQRTTLTTIASVAMFSRGLEPEFPEAVHRQLSSLRHPAREEGPHIRDLTALPWCSIDNDDSRDLDQLTVIEPLPKGAVRVMVAVADVDALVKPGTPIDDHARYNTTSVYTSARVFHMLPERLCTDLTSLNLDEDRLALVTEMSFSDDGILTGSSIFRARVRNKAQLAYDAVSAWIEGEADLPEALFEGDHITDIRQQQHNRGRQLIEEFMIATNGCTARFLSAQGRGALRRVVRSPERWQRITEVAQGYGVTLPRQPDGKALETFLAHQHQVDPLRFPDLSLVIVKLMGSGEYLVEQAQATPVGHFGLAVQDYMHSTAPNRRFPDLITLRLIKAALAGTEPPYSHEELHELARHCTAQEDAARKVERQLRKSEAALLLHARVGQLFDALVTGSTDRGAWVRTFDPPVEGRLSGDLPDLDVGQVVRVRLVSTSVERGFIDFELAH